MVLATRISTRFGKRNTAVGMHLIGLTLTPMPIILRMLGWFPENGSPLIVPILFGVSMIAMACGTVGAILWYSMTADVVEDAQLNTGRRSEGLLFAANAFVLKCVSGIGLGRGGLILGLVDFPQHAQPGAVPEATLTRQGTGCQRHACAHSADHRRARHHVGLAWFWPLAVASGCRFRRWASVLIRKHQRGV